MRTNAGETRFAGVAALFAGTAWVAWATLNTRTHGGLDVGAAAVGERMSRVGALLMVSWNLLLIPAALVLYATLVELHPRRIRLATACGLVSLLFWAYGGATHGITPALEVSYIALSGVWWLGIGVTMWPTNKVFGGLTIALGAFAFWDALLTGLEPVPFTLYLTAAPKLPLSILWDFALGYVLLRRSVTPITHLATSAI
jgi:hypothetical protein